MSRSRQLSPLPDDLPPTVRALLGELRLLKDRSGYDLRALATKTHSSRSSWGRWLSGETWIPRDAVASMAELCAGDPARLTALWQQAEDERQARQFVAPAETRAAAHERDAAGGGTTTEVRPPSTGEHPEPKKGTARSRLGWAVFVVTALCCVVATGAAGLAIGRSFRDDPAQPATRPYTQWLTRPEILSRVRTWHPHTDQRIPYSQNAFYQGYRTDGSGYASMAIGLPTPGPTSPDLASGQYTRRISPQELLPGDLIINPSGAAGTRQVAVFDTWADVAHTRYWVYQQRREYGTDHLVLAYPLGGSSRYQAYRPQNIHEGHS